MRYNKMDEVMDEVSADTSWPCVPAVSLASAWVLVLKRQETIPSKEMEPRQPEPSD